MIWQIVKDFYKPTKEKLYGFAFYVIGSCIIFGWISLLSQITCGLCIYPTQKISLEEIIVYSLAGSIALFFLFPLIIPLPLFPFFNLLLLVFLLVLYSMFFSMAEIKENKVSKQFCMSSIIPFVTLIFCLLSSWDMLLCRNAPDGI